MATAAIQNGESAEARAAAVPRRRWWTRFGYQHVLMVAAGVVAVAANLVVLRAGDPQTAILVARSDLRPGDVLSTESFDLTSVPTAGVTAARFIEDAGWVVGREVRRPLSQGDPILESDLRPPGLGGSRAMSLSIDPQDAVAGALVAGDIVDVIAADGGTARYVASGLDVVAVTGDAGRFGGSAWAVTVAVDDRQALQLAAALAAGRVHLVRANGAGPVTAPVWPAPSEAVQ
ncbi:MAG: Flp pilus assembly protein CpaB [Acidimicrobiia bacterium]